MRIGGIEVQVVSGGTFRLDGGGMFGVVPRPLWTRQFTPDERGRVELETNCLLVRTADELILVDTGNGGKLNEKERDIFAVPTGEPLVENLAALGVQPDEVTTVLLTHLHMDHVGGATRTEGEAVVPVFPRARFVVQRQEWDDALANRSHMRTSYRRENLEPLEQSDRLTLLNGDGEVAPGVRVQMIGGHTRAHQSVWVSDGGETLFYPADLCPTPAHVRPMYSMAFDMSPYDSVVAKAELLPQAEREGWLIVFDHEPEAPVGRLVWEDRQLRSVPA